MIYKYFHQVASNDGGKKLEHEYICVSIRQTQSINNTL